LKSTSIRMSSGEMVDVRTAALPLERAVPYREITNSQHDKELDDRRSDAPP